ncbi:hypothetical protein VNO77_04214 [Canavalia gladiata]|uniref:Uncharacterized protein n=1 Tax=Canavalia gladiata TaxID=3824 RepID=A0AAN9N193_CANGL
MSHFVQNLTTTWCSVTFLPKHKRSQTNHNPRLFRHNIYVIPNQMQSAVACKCLSHIKVHLSTLRLSLRSSERPWISYEVMRGLRNRVSAGAWGYCQRLLEATKRDKRIVNKTESSSEKSSSPS